jgi:hypothetical protein
LKKQSVSSAIPLSEKQEASAGKKFETLNNVFGFVSTLGKCPPSSKMIGIQY